MMLSGNAKLAGVMGWPVSHSRSPRLHGYWLEHYGIDGAYVPLAVAPENLGAALAALPKLGFRGCNLTIPHKEAALAHVAKVEPTARIIGAINTVVVDDAGALVGSNTDIAGFVANVREGAATLDTSRRALVIGAGGAARAVTAGLKTLGFARAVVVNRTPARAESLVRDLASLGLQLEPYAVAQIHDVLGDISLIVNTTSLGMSGQPALELDLAAVRHDTVVTDIVYTPLETPLLADARARGLATVDGLGMLLHQARAGFHAWYGVLPDVTASLRSHMLGG